MKNYSIGICLLAVLSLVACNQIDKKYEGDTDMYGRTLEVGIKAESFLISLFNYDLRGIRNSGSVEMFRSMEKYDESEILKIGRHFLYDSNGKERKYLLTYDNLYARISGNKDSGQGVFTVRLYEKLPNNGLTSMGSIEVNCWYNRRAELSQCKVDRVSFEYNGQTYNEWSFNDLVEAIAARGA